MADKFAHLLAAQNVLRYCFASPDGFTVEEAQQFVVDNYRSSSGDQIGCGPNTTTHYIARLLEGREVKYVLLFDERGIQAVDVVEVVDNVAHVHITALSNRYAPGPLHVALSHAVANLLDFERWQTISPPGPAVDYMMKQSFVVDGKIEEVNNGFIKASGAHPGRDGFDGNVPLA